MVCELYLNRRRGGEPKILRRRKGPVPYLHEKPAVSGDSPQLMLQRPRVAVEEGKLGVR